MTDAVFILDAKLPVPTIVECNKAAEAISGYTREEVVGNSKIWEWLYPEEKYRKEVTDKAASIIQGLAADVEDETIIRTKSGENRVISWCSRNLVNDKGVSIGSVALGRDITGRKRVEEALRESEAKYSALVEQAKDVVAIVQDGVCKFVNKAAEEFSGFAVEEIVGKPFLNWMTPESRDLVAQRYKLRMAGEKVPSVYEAKIQCKDGAIKDIEVSAGLIQYQGKPADIVIARDATERKLMEKELRQSEEKFRRIATHIEDVLYSVDGETQEFRYLSPAFERLLGYTLEDIRQMGGRRAFLSRVIQGGKFAEQNRYFERLRLQRGMKDMPDRYETWWLCKDGSLKCLEDRWIPVYEGERLVSTDGVLRDITERKKTEEQIERLAKFPSENPNPVLRLDQDGVVFDANKASDPLLRDWGCKDGGVAPKFWRDLAAEALASQSSKSVDIEIGEQVYSFFVAPVKETGYVNLYGRNITDRKRAEEKLKQYSEHLEELVEERTRDIKLLNESVIQRLTQKIGQIDNVATIRDKLRKTADISSGLDLILDTALNDLGMDVGAVLLIDHKENAARLRGFKSRIEGVKVEESYSLDKGFAEFEAYKDNKNLSKVVRQSELSALGTASIHCAPILLGREVYGVLAFGSQKALTLDESDLAVLSLYAELTSILFETQSLVVAPVKEVAEGAKRKFELESGSSYLVKNDVEKAFEVFTDNVLGGFEGLCITRQFPSKVRRKYGLEKTPIVWLTSERVEGETAVHSIQDLSILIANFLDRAKRGVVLLDGLEYLITNHGFEISIRFLQTARSRFEQKDAILIAPLLEKAIDAKEATLIEREMKPLIAQ